MSTKQLVRLALIFVALLVLWGATALAHRRSGGRPSAGEGFRLPSIPRKDIDTIVLARPADTAVLARRDSAWTVNGHPVASGMVTGLLDALADTAPPAELVAERRSSHAALGVDSASGTRVQVHAGGRTALDLIVGHSAEDLDGGYVRMADQEPTYQVRGRLVSMLERGTDEWRDHRIASLAPDSVAEIEVTRGPRRYSVRRAAAGWNLSPGGAADSAGVAELLAAYRNVQASGFATAAQADSADFKHPDRRVRVLGPGGTPLLGLVIDSTASGVWARADTGSTVYRIDSWLADRLAPADATLRARGPGRQAK